MEELNIFKFKDVKMVPDPFINNKYPSSSSTSSKSTTIVVDNGSYQCRMGWSSSGDIVESYKSANQTSNQMFVSNNDTLGPGGIIYKNVMAKTRKEKGKESELQVANDIFNIEAVRYNLKTPFDRNVVTQFETQEVLLDYGFAHLGLNEFNTRNVTERANGSVPYPIVMTEPFGNPNSCRAAMSELLFECYSVPSVAYGIDAMFSLYKNKSEKVASNACSGIIVSIGFHTVHIIPILDGKISTKGVRRINIGGFHLTNYALKAMQLKYPSHVANITVGRAEEILQYHCRVVTDYNHEIAKWSDTEFYNRNVKRLQLPFNLVPRTPVADPDVVKQRRQELAKRLVEMNAKKREEKLNEDKATLRTLQTCLTLYEQGYEDKVKRMIARLTDSNTPGNSNDDHLSVKSSDDIKKIIDKTKSRIEKSILVLERKRNSETNKDNTVNEKNEQPEIKKRREDMDEVEKKELDATINDVKLKRQELLDKRAARHHRKQQLAKRRTAASQERMRIITQLAKKSSKKDSDKDNFGMEDSDWDVYKQINKDIGDSDSEEEQNLLNEYDQVLKEADPNDEGDGTCGGNEICRDSPEWYQLHLATEQIRISEILFQPSIIGHEQAGISETIEFILKKFSASEQSKLVSDVFLTGSLSCLSGIKSRLEKDLKEMRPFKSSFNVRTAKYPSADAWNGAKKFANTSPSSNFISRQEYEEMGSEYLSVHHCSNMYVPSPEEVEEIVE